MIKLFLFAIMLFPQEKPWVLENKIIRDATTNKFIVRTVDIKLPNGSNLTIGIKDSAISKTGLEKFIEARIKIHLSKLPENSNKQTSLLMKPLIIHTDSTKLELDLQRTN